MHYLLLVLAFGIFMVYVFMQEIPLVSVLVMGLLVLLFIGSDIYRTQKKHSKDESGIYGHLGNELTLFSFIILVISLILIKTKVVTNFVGMVQFEAFFASFFLAVSSLVLCIIGIKGLRHILDETKDRKAVNVLNYINIVIDLGIIIYTMMRLIRIFKGL